MRAGRGRGPPGRSAPAAAAAVGRHEGVDAGAGHRGPRRVSRGVARARAPRPARCIDRDVGDAGADGRAVTEASSPGAAAEAARILAAAILDQHSVWWALASPLFALSVAPYLLFLKNIWEVPSATDR